MIVAWLLSLMLFAAGIYATLSIFSEIKEKDQLDLVQLENQFHNIDIDLSRKHAV